MLQTLSTCSSSHIYRFSPTTATVIGYNESRGFAGNKCDVELADRSVPRAEGEALALTQNLPYVEVSPRASINVGLVMTAMVR